MAKPPPAEDSSDSSVHPEGKDGRVGIGAGYLPNSIPLDKRAGVVKRLQQKMCQLIRFTQRREYRCAFSRLVMPARSFGNSCPAHAQRQLTGVDSVTSVTFR